MENNSTRTEAVRRALTTLNELYPDHDLQNLWSDEVTRRLACTKENCKCTDEKVVTDTLGSLLRQHEEFLPRNNEEVPLDEPWAEIPIPKKRPDQTYRADVKFEQAYRLLDNISREFMHARHDPENVMDHNLLQCDCIRWLLNTFDSLRSPALFRFFKAFNMHNTYMIAIFAFCIENDIIDRPEMAPMRFAVGNVTANWWCFVKQPVGKGYRRDRKRKRLPFRNFRPNHCLPAKNKWERLLGQLRENFPGFFDEVDMGYKFNRDAVVRADPGATTNCNGCKEEFPSRYMIQCEAITNEDEGNADQPKESHSHCRKCFKKYWYESLNSMDEITADKITTKDANKTKFYTRCMEEKCPNIYSTEVLRKHLVVPIRAILFRMVVERSFKQAFVNAHSQEAIPNAEGAPI